MTLMVTQLVGFGSGSSVPATETFSTMGGAHTAYDSNVTNHAMQFTPTYGGTVTSAEMGGTQFGGQNWSARIYTNNSGSPGSTVGSASGSVAAVTHPSTHSLTFGTPPSVTAGTTYWIVFSRSTSTDGVSCCAAVGGVVTGCDNTITSITDGLGMGGAELRCSVTITT